MGKHIARILSAELEGIEARIVEVEADVNVGLHSFTIVGLGDRSLCEAKERVNSALKHSGMKPPNRENRKITINLAPADIQKTGSHYDLAIAISYLIATDQIGNFATEDKIFLGELSLDGKLRAVHGALNVAQCANVQRIPLLFVPNENAEEASAIAGIKVIAADTLREVMDILMNRSMPRTIPLRDKEMPMTVPSRDFSDIAGQENAKRALTIAAAGRHNILMAGPPGVGKTMLAQAMRGILTPLTEDEAIEVTKIWSAAGMHRGGLIGMRPFRAPHHTLSASALIGGGRDPRPGEISLAHRGVLFLDELPEFPRNAIEALRQPMESGSVALTRTEKRIILPAEFLLVAAMNPCPCGYLADDRRECRCTTHEILKYRKKISGPMLDRIDLRVRVERVDPSTIMARRESDTENESRQKIVARAQTFRRSREASANVNGTLPGSRNIYAIRRKALLNKKAERFLKNLGVASLSPRGYCRLIDVARTIADLEACEKVTEDHLAEAFGYRVKEW